jgi:drug/metabolite transporter (DMT)-like permease
MPILYGLSAAFCFGVADFYATKATRRVGVLITLFAVQAIGGLAILPIIVLKQEPLSGSAANWLEMVACSFVSYAGVLFLYRAFTVGTLSLVSPIASGFAVVTAGLAFAFGERPPGLAILGAILLVGGVVVVSTTRAPAAAALSGVPEAIGATICFGFYFWAVGELTSELGVYWPVLITRVVELVLAGICLAVRKPVPISKETRTSVMPYLVAAGVLDSAALLTFNLGVDSAYTSTTTALTSLYSAVTVLLAWLLLRERLARQQWVGVAVLMVGVLLVSL